MRAKGTCAAVGPSPKIEFAQFSKLSRSGYTSGVKTKNSIGEQSEALI